MYVESEQAAAQDRWSSAEILQGSEGSHRNVRPPRSGSMVPNTRPGQQSQGDHD